MEEIKKNKIKNKDKMQQDFSEITLKTIEEQTKVAYSGKLNEAIENLLLLEKQTRQSEDYINTSKIAITIIKLCYELKNFKFLNENLIILSKRRGQLRTVIQDIVRESMNYLDKLDKNIKLELINTLKQITEGKIFVEIERARLIKILAKIKEEEGKINEAADILQEIQVETFGQMDKIEKTDFILEQMRLCLDKKDFIKAQIISNKISRKAIKEEEFQDLKIKFYEQMVRFYFHEKKYLEICKCYKEIYDTSKIKKNENEFKKYLSLYVIFICLSPFDNEQFDLMNRINNDKNLLKIPIYKSFISLFLTKELMKWNLIELKYSKELNNYFLLFNQIIDEKNILWIDLKKRIIEHNIRVIETYYNRITMKRISSLLDLTINEVETFISDLVSNKIIFAKINRPQGIIHFRKRRDPNQQLNEWVDDVSILLNTLEKTCHLIERENMVHKIEV